MCTLHLVLFRLKKQVIFLKKNPECWQLNWQLPILNKIKQLKKTFAKHTGRSFSLTLTFDLLTSKLLHQLLMLEKTSLINIQSTAAF